MKGRLIKMATAVTLGMLLMGTVAATAAPAGGVHVKAVVVKVAHVASGGAYVTLSALTTNSTRQTAKQLPIRYAWDLTTDGNFETPLSLSPVTTQYYAPTTTGLVTATIKAVGGSSVRGTTDSVTFSILSPKAGAGRFHVTAIVVKVAQVATNGAIVTLSALTTSSAKIAASTMPIRYSWDLTTDGNYETPLSLSPTVKQFYAHSASGLVTATIKAIGGSAVRGTTDSVTFSTLPPRAPRSHLQIKAIVVKMVPAAVNGWFVTLSALTTSSAKIAASTMPIRYTWDLTTDGVFETPLSLSPTTTQFYTQSASGLAKATVKAIGGSAVRGAMDSVTFSMLQYNRS